MKTLVFISLVAFSNMSFAAELNLSETQVNALENIVKANLGEERAMEGAGYCEEIENNQVQCSWYIEGTGRTPDTMNGVFEVIDGEFKLVEAFEEYGC
ncbi:hypothetical protein [Bdellovibrio svalbardensis]|uniref:PepSY domain-containing protein n=1 Tax=Bdellovibrio svalbardensis TaxID=2972972 RepID=A0ABT6DMY7_9BACT|nr:hypothetical protein [Bdellovibrio svalbardensis]MDG0816498.1 hypothetical protein [Bdellovibrio svalbardensis]